jgi:hypothetical protein
VKAAVIPVITEAPGTISKSLRQHVSNIPGKHKIKEKMMKGGGEGGGSHIVHCTQTAGNANVKVHNILHWQNNITCNTNCQYRTAATPYTLETWFVSCIQL